MNTIGTAAKPLISNLEFKDLMKEIETNPNALDEALKNFTLEEMQLSIARWKQNIFKNK